MTDNETFRAPPGTHDVLPPVSSRWQALVSIFSGLVERAGYGLVVTPLFEDAGVFSRAVGQATDMVSKEMYEFEDRGGRKLVLRPEVTASVVRAFIQHRPTLPWKAWYWGPNFRYERPQAGRYRQFFQLGVEAFGVEDPGLDVEVVALASGLGDAVGLSQVELLVNSLGDAECRPAYGRLLSEFLSQRETDLCDEHRTRWTLNPLRVLDCKRDACRSATEDAPRQLDHLCQPCRRHWEAVLAGLEALGIRYVVETRLVRGLDYYTRTTFELASGALESAQNAVGGGGRYDGLVENLGGPPTPAIGFSFGLDRLLLACDAEGTFPAPSSALDAYVVDVAGGMEAVTATHELRRAGLRVDRAFAATDQARSMKSQLRAADRSGAAVAVIIGSEEAASAKATVKALRGEPVQELVDRAEVADAVRRLSRAPDRGETADR